MVIIPLSIANMTIKLETYQQWQGWAIIKIQCQVLLTPLLYRQVKYILELVLHMQALQALGLHKMVQGLHKKSLEQIYTKIEIRSHIDFTKFIFYPLSRVTLAAEMTPAEAVTRSRDENMLNVWWPRYDWYNVKLACHCYTYH